jgi:hypothetical protein
MRELRKMIWKGHAARMREQINASKRAGGNTEGERETLRILGRRWGII